MSSPGEPPRPSSASYARLFIHARSSTGHGADDLEDCHRLRLAFDHDVAERSKLILPFQPPASGFADDNPSAVLFVQRLEPRAQIHGVADHRIAHDRLASDVSGDHRAGIDADADAELGVASLRLPPRVQ